MNAPGLDASAREQILHRDVLPLCFPDAPAPQAPSFVLVAGQPGAGRSRASSRLVRDAGTDLAVLNPDDLRTFHPGSLDLQTGADPAASAALAEAVAGWVSACIRYAREHHRSVALEGTFANTEAAAGTAQRFAAEGFTTRVVVVGSRRAESLLSVTSGYLSDVRANRSAVLTSRQVHDEAFGATRRLVASVEGSVWVDRVTVVGRDGSPVFDASRGDGSGFEGATAALAAAHSSRMGRFDATQWLSELHHITDFAATRRGLAADVTELLVDLHETSLREVIPQLHVPAGGKFATAMEQKTVATLVALRKTLPLTPAPTVDLAAPVVVPAGPERAGPSR